MLRSILLIAFSACALVGQSRVVGFQAEYLDDFSYTSKQVVQLATATPAEKYAWRPAPGVRSVSEVYMHIATGNYLLLAVAGVKPPAEYYPNPVTGGGALAPLFKRNLELEKSITDKDKVVRLLKDSLDAVRDQFSKMTPEDFDKPSDAFGEKTTVRRVYVRIIAHVNEHMGQSIAYARMNGVVPPWSEKK